MPRPFPADVGIAIGQEPMFAAIESAGSCSCQRPARLSVVGAIKLPLDLPKIDPEPRLGNGL